MLNAVHEGLEIQWLSVSVNVTRNQSEKRSLHWKTATSSSHCYCCYGSLLNVQACCFQAEAGAAVCGV